MVILIAISMVMLLAYFLFSAIVFFDMIDTYRTKLDIKNDITYNKEKVFYYLFYPVIIIGDWFNQEVK